MYMATLLEYIAILPVYLSIFLCMFCFGQQLRFGVVLVLPTVTHTALVCG